MRRALVALAVVAVALGVVLVVRDDGTGLPLEEIGTCQRPRVLDDPPFVEADAPASVAFEPFSDVGGVLAIDHWPDGRLALAQRIGTVALLDGDGTTETILDITDRIELNAEGGLLGLAVDPDGSHLYLHHTDLEGTSRVLSYAITDPTAAAPLDPASERELLSQPHPGLVHNGGHLLFGPDEMLYVGFGDGTLKVSGALESEGRGTLAAKVLRIDPTPDAEEPYAIPADNPDPEGDRGRPEIYAEGLRNPWRFSFDRDTGDLWIGDVGNDCYEEINVIDGSERSRDFGWPRFEGVHALSTTEDDGVSSFPRHVHPHRPICAVIGGYVYRGDAIPALQGSYVYQDLCEGELRWLRLTDEGAEGGLLGEQLEFVLAFWEDEVGELYALTAEMGVHRLVAAD